MTKDSPRYPHPDSARERAQSDLSPTGRGEDTALVLFSGGQDSTVCLAWALERFARVETVGFSYGQRHAVELDVRPRVRDRMAALDRGWAARLG